MRQGTAPVRFSAGVIVVHGDPGARRFLLLRAYRNWDFPKGMVEPHEAPLDAARREVREETGITELAFEWGEDYRETAPYNRGKIARYYLAATRSPNVELSVNPELGRPEHDEYRWTTHDEALALLPARLIPILDWAQATLNDGKIS
jgi:8-oxo-dGTP pyrophosphatase MutT (NUDIX family)